MDSEEEHKEENKSIYNIILVTVIISGLACSLWMHCVAPSPPSVRLNSLSASYRLKPSESYHYPQRVMYDDTTFNLNITVVNEDDKWAARFDHVDVWVNARVKNFLRTKLASQNIMVDRFVLQPKEGKVLELKVRQDRGVRVTEWNQLLVSVYVRAQFEGAINLIGRPRMMHRTRDCANLIATLHKATGTAVVESNLPMLCNAPY